MNWNGKDAALFQQQKDYIDTAIVPLVPADFGAGMMQSAEQHEFIGLLVAFLERQFKGRVLVTPPHAYLPDADGKMEGAIQWSEKLRAAGFKHVFFFTADGAWRGLDKELGAAVIWIPSVPLGDMEDRVKYSLIENQANKIVNTVVEKWQENAG